jgi:hypothetical protein
MPKTWIFFIVVGLPLVVWVALRDIGLVELLWYQGYEQLYYTLSALRANAHFQEFFGGWPLPVFTLTVMVYWSSDGEAETIESQFYLLPLAYVPFSVFGTMLVNREFDAALFYIHPFVLIPAGYLYLLPWILFVRVFNKLNLLL